MISILMRFHTLGAVQAHSAYHTVMVDGSREEKKKKHTVPTMNVDRNRICVEPNEEEKKWRKNAYIIDMYEYYHRQLYVSAREASTVPHSSHSHTHIFTAPHPSLPFLATLIYSACLCIRATATFLMLPIAV